MFCFQSFKEKKNLQLFKKKKYFQNLHQKGTKRYQKSFFLATLKFSCKIFQLILSLLYFHERFFCPVAMITSLISFSRAHLSIFLVSTIKTHYKSAPLNFTYPGCPFTYAIFCYYTYFKTLSVSFLSSILIWCVK